MKKILNITLLALALAGCTSLEPQELPFQEEYLRNFIDRFGLIDPNQDFNLAERSHVSILVEEDASKIVVYANIFDHYYRVARCTDVAKGAIDIPIDIPVNTTDLAIDIDGKVYITDPAGKVDSRNLVSPSRAVQPYLDENDALGWVIVSEDLGSVDDVDFNDFVARLTYTENSYQAFGEVTPDAWDRIDQNIGTSDEGYIHESRAGEESGTTKITIKALASGGTMGIWLHYRNSADADDYVIGKNGVSVLTSTLNKATAAAYEWHGWFGVSSRNMVNTTPELVRRGATTEFEVPGEFSFTTYSMLTYEHVDPKDAYNFNFDRRQIKGFYITVTDFAVDITAGNTPAAFDVGRAVGQCRELGLPPQMFLIPDICSTDGGTTVCNHYKWPLERVSIDTAYDGFDTWVTKGEGLWYKNADVNKVVTDRMMDEILGN